MALVICPALIPMVLYFWESSTCIRFFRENWFQKYYFRTQLAHLGEKSRHGDKRNRPDTQAVGETWWKKGYIFHTSWKVGVKKTCSDEAGQGEYGAGHYQREAHPNLRCSDPSWYWWAWQLTTQSMAMIVTYVTDTVSPSQWSKWCWPEPQRWWWERRWTAVECSVETLQRGRRRSPSWSSPEI